MAAMSSNPSEHPGALIDQVRAAAADHQPLRTVGGEYSAKDVEGIRGAAMFWYVTVGLYLVLWYAIYITK